MSRKRMGFGLLALFAIALMGWFAFQTDKSVRKSSSIPSDQAQELKNRELILGEPQFVPKSQVRYSSLRKHVESQWGLKDISLLKAWAVLEEEKQRADPLTVAVVDTGIHTQHPCLKTSLWINPDEVPGNGKDDDRNGFVDDIHGWNFVDNNNNIQDYHGHGTHISGIIAARGKTAQSPECQVIGVAPHVRIMTLKYFDEEAKSDENIENTVKAIKYAVQNGADIINYSGGGPGAQPDEKASIAKAADKGIIFVAAFGNEGMEIGKREKYYPASYNFQNILPVVSQDGTKVLKSSNRPKFNRWDNQKSQIAPGEGIQSTLPPGIYLQSHLAARALRGLAAYTHNHNRYGKMTGTSQATAFATGVVALVKTRYPTWSMPQIINQVDKTGFGQGTEKIKEAVNQGKKLSAYEALIMRDRNVDLSDQTDRTNTVIPHDPDNVDALLKNPKQPRREMEIHNPNPKENDPAGQLEVLEGIANFKKKKSK